MHPRTRLLSDPLRICCLLLFAAPLGARQEADRPVRRPLPTPEEIAALPADGGPEFNRLVFEQSPYLLQHARNPVDWYPWGDAAFARAAAEDKPVFLSIGYSTCHWCHVMEHESFEDAEVAALLNESFVCVKVDREERPDIDQVYMAYTQALTGSGGWPMTVLLTPDKRPFFAGTYFPKQGRFGRPGMVELVPGLARAWRERRESVLQNAEQAVQALAGMTSGTPGEPLGVDVLALAAESLKRGFDTEHGGFGSAPKFPIPHQLSLLLRHHLRTGDELALRMVEKTLHAMRRGGIFDQVGFGLHRYSTDAVWLVPHFEKMLYDQALFAIACVEAWQVTGDAEQRETAELVLAYVRRDMTAPEGGFYSAEDADSEGEEGLFYVWTPAQLADVLGEEDAALAAAWWDVGAEGNYREESTGAATGRSIPRRLRELSALAAERGEDQAALAARLEVLRRKLFEAREARVHPLKDDKVLTDWNGLMIAAFAKAARAFGSREHLETARRAADFALATLRDADGRLYKRHRNGESGLPGMLEDYAFLAWGLLELYESSFEVRYLAAARGLVDAAEAHFWDAEHGGFFLSPDDGEALIVRSRDVYDGALPSGNSVMVGNLQRLARITSEGRYQDLAEATVRAFAGDVRRNPSAYTMLLQAVDFDAGPSFEVVVAGDPAAADTRAMLEALGARFLPHAVVLLRPDGERPEICAVAPWTEAQVARDGKATAYVCRDFACEQPTHELERVLESLSPARQAR